MQRLFTSSETTDNKEFKKSASATHYYCIGDDFELLHPYLDHFRSSHAGLEPTGENLLKKSFPKGVIQLFPSVKSASITRDSTDSDSSLEQAFILLDNEQRTIIQASTYFKVRVDNKNDLKKSFIKWSVPDGNGWWDDTIKPCLEASIDQISEISSVNYIFYHSEEGRQYDLTVDLTGLSKEFLHAATIGMKRPR